MIAKIEDKFGKEVRKMRKMTTARTPGKRVKGKFEDEEKLTGEMQTRYRSGVGMLLFMVKHSRPDLSNAVCELSKCMGKANNDTY